MSRPTPARVLIPRRAISPIQTEGDETETPPYSYVLYEKGDEVRPSISGVLKHDITNGKANKPLHILLVHSRSKIKCPWFRSTGFDHHPKICYILPVEPKPNYHRRILSTGIDFTEVRQWLAHCDSKHQCCSHSDDTGPLLQGLKLIDCETEQVVDAESGWKYVALSYVWGRGHQDDTSEHQTFPPTIKDSMHVVRNLGLRYLWVDRYCISQTNGKEMQHMFNNMGSIYEKAVFTIIAAVDTSDDGLPGVRDGYRIWGVSNSSGTTWDIVFKSPIYELKDSCWDTRGWTYQEGILSRRCLIFSKTQVTFRCLVEGYYQEGDGHRNRYRIKGMPTNDSECSWEDKRVYKRKPLWSAHMNYMGSRPFIGRSEVSIIERPEVSIIEHINSYTSRCLTNEGDMLWAFLGIFSVYNKPSSNMGISHLFGLPIMYRPAGTDGQRGTILPEYFIHSMLWTLQRSGLRRVPKYPSWTWAGWSGFSGLIYPLVGDKDGYTIPYGYALERYGRQSLDCEVHFRRDSLGVRLNLEELMSYIIQDLPKYAGDESRKNTVFLGDLDRAIYWTGWTTEVRFSDGGDGTCFPKGEQSMRKDWGNGLFMPHGLFTPHGKTATELGTGLWTVIVMRWSSPVGDSGATSCLVLAKEGPDCFSRIGMIETEWDRINPDEISPNTTQVVKNGRTFTRKCIKII
ncbi:heterokaryon incompatibility protein-domain-containing protein [Daldinia vernicosa]|uniref:heterokaryon incompatibility protein-domain-containing protein n=1 Tax=Daldinia vernicosa TaxID=114800 RepID=UPI002008021D|nr:heterokaryon incompatibility protein-domain-containing protein [Daldinia vernicosa]KAI0844772.1 heterokaryon incompatibility protein-domain-containing protein [Daldinia vernicosa]